MVGSGRREKVVFRTVMLGMERINYLDLRGQVAIVTGSTRGIGRACARELAEHGAHVFLNGRNEETLQDALADFRGQGLIVDGTAGDVSDEHFTREFISGVLAKENRIDILINNAGGTDWKMFEDMDTALWERDINANLKSAFLMSRAVLPIMKQQKGGRIVNMASVVGIHGRSGGAAYVTAKSGLIGLTKALSQELGKYSIAVNAIAPGLIDTDHAHHMGGQDYFEREAKKTPLGRVGTPEDVAKVALFLSSSLSQFVSGQVIVVNGGMIMIV